MVIFPFTKKKFLSLSRDKRHKWLIKWLSQIYRELASNRLNNKSYALFLDNYFKVLEWMDEDPYTIPRKNYNTRECIEFVSDSIHKHRIKLGFTPKDYDLLPEITTKDRGIKQSNSPCFNYHIALDGLRSLFNTGSIFRICDAAGFKSIILGNTCGPEHPVVQKTSMGTSKWISYEKTDDIASALEKMKIQDFKIIGVETVRNSDTYINYNWPKKGIIVFGNEEYGISSHVMKVCDDFVHIPMFGRKNSLNIANAVSIIVFHIASVLS